MHSKHHFTLKYQGEKISNIVVNICILKEQDMNKTEDHFILLIDTLVYFLFNIFYEMFSIISICHVMT